MTESLVYTAPIGNGASMTIRYTPEQAAYLAKREAERANPAPVKAFETGRTYSCRSIGDSECIWSFTILDRTNKTVTIRVDGKDVRRGLSIWEGVERFKPFGSYSFAPSVAADAKDLRALDLVNECHRRGR